MVWSPVVNIPQLKCVPSQSKHPQQPSTKALDSKQHINNKETPSCKLDFRYEAYGLVLHSNLPIEGLMPARSSNKSPDIKINLGLTPTGDPANSNCRLRYASSYLDEVGEPALQVWVRGQAEFFHIRFSDGVEFWLDRDFSTLWGQWPENITLEYALGYLLGPVFGLLLRLRGVICLHASAVNINDRSVVFVGSEGAGKSTTAAAFARQGFCVLSDDIVGLAEHGHEFRTLAAAPRINLWPDSVEILYGSPEALPRITGGSDKRYLVLGENAEAKFEERALRLGAIYILGDGSAEDRRCVEEVTQKTALMLLVPNTYATNFLDAEQRAEEFAVLSRLVAAVPVRMINSRKDVVGPEEFCEIIRRDFAALDSR
jgi:hypothetical protein